ncbi:MAG: endonuclease MutS2, partial [Sphingobacterium sp.]
MIYPKNVVEKLGFTEIKELIKAKCLSEPGRELVEKIQPQIKPDLIDRFLRQTQEFKNLIEHDSPLPLDHFYPLKTIIEKARVE